MELNQNDNFISSDFVNQGYDQNFNQTSMKRYTDLPDDIPTNINIKNQMNNFNSYNNINNRNNIPQNQNQTQKNIENKNPILEKEIIPERNLSHFYGNDFLTDAILKTENFELPFHKIV